MIVMENPWLNLCLSEGSYVLKDDRVAIGKFNESVRDPKAKVIVESIPEPFIGNPDSARVVLLGLNPGHSDEDEEAYSNDDFRNAMFQNLRHEQQEYPFYPLNPKFEWTAAAKWWRPRTRELRDKATRAGIDAATFAKRLLVIEWFPYHSKKSGLPTTLVCPSQEYSFQLVKQMVERKLPILLMYKKHWLKTRQWLPEPASLNSSQCTYITSGNMEGRVFHDILKAIEGKT